MINHCLKVYECLLSLVGRNQLASECVVFHLPVSVLASEVATGHKYPFLQDNSPRTSCMMVIVNKRGYFALTTPDSK